MIRTTARSHRFSVASTASLLALASVGLIGVACGSGDSPGSSDPGPSSATGGSGSGPTGSGGSTGGAHAAGGAGGSPSAGGATNGFSGGAGVAGASAAAGGGAAASAGTSAGVGGGAAGKGGSASSTGGNAGSGATGGAACKADGASSGNAAACCSKQIDAFGACCTGKHCCAAFNHSGKNPAKTTECVCNAGYDWASTDPTDYSCVPVKDHVVDCSAVGHTDPLWCTCTTDKNTGPTKVTGSCVKDPSFAPMTCCADSAYPSSGACECYLSQAWRCLSFDSTSCSCDYFWAADAVQYTTTVCDAVPEPNGTPWRCCATKYGTCECKQNGAACAVGEKEVSDCASDVKIGLSPFKGCATGQTQVSGCSNLGTGGTGGSGSGGCKSDADCPADCTGDDPVCCGTCKPGGYCGQICCSSSGTCF